jgi:hypothetical protein
MSVCILLQSIPGLCSGGGSFIAKPPYTHRLALLSNHMVYLLGQGSPVDWLNLSSGARHFGGRWQNAVPETATIPFGRAISVRQRLVPLSDLSRVTVALTFSPTCKGLTSLNAKASCCQILVSNRRFYFKCVDSLWFNWLPGTRGLGDAIVGNRALKINLCTRL